MESIDYKKRLKVSMIFFIFSVCIILAFVSIHHILFSQHAKKLAIKNGINKTKEREFYVKNFLINSEKTLFSIKNSNVFYDYFCNKSDINNLNNLFLTIAFSNENIMQLRYIDKDGKEIVRVERDNYNESAYITPKDKLQDKSKRYYYTNSKIKQLDKVWFSPIDLNIENGKVDVPYRPTFRAVLPISNDSKFDGVLIINYFMENFLDGLLYTPLYDIVLINERGYTLRHYQKDKDWGYYQDKKVDINSLYPKLSSGILNNTLFVSDDFVSRKFDLPIENGLIMILQLNNNFLKEEHNSEIEMYFIVSFIIAIVSFISSIFITAKFKDILFDLKRLKEYASLVDKNVLTSSTDLKGNITNVSYAFCKVSGYEKNELLGKNHRIIKHKDMPQKVYEDMWHNLVRDKIWEGEIKNISKKGEVFWVYMYVYPLFENNKKIGYTAIRHNITDRKKLEELTNKDGLTNIYNRRYFNNIFPKIVKDTKDNLVCFMMIDIDFFKQYNDTYGHFDGDKVIISVANFISNFIDDKDYYTFRLGGEEFGVVFLCNDKNKSIKIADDIRDGIERLKIPHKNNRASPYVTISAGLICVNPKKEDCDKQMYKLCDDYLYQAKSNGRNCVKHN